MALGDSTWSIQTGSGQVKATSQQIARAVVHLGVTPLGAVNTVIPVSNDSGSILAALDYCALAEVVAFTGRAGLVKYVVPVNPSQVGGVSASVTQVGSGTGTATPTVAPHKTITIKCVTGGAIATATFQFSLDGGTTYGAVIPSTGSAPWTYLVPGTFTTLSFAAATYVATKTCTVDTTGTVTNGSAWVGVVTQTSSPLDDYEPVVSILKGGALGTAVISVSLDNGNSTEIGQLLTPSSGVVTITNTGLVVTLAGTFTTGDTYSFLASRPGYNTTDINNAMNALKQVRTLQVSLIHLEGMPASAAGAFSAVSTLETSLEDAFSNKGFDWQGISDCPSSKGGTRVTSVITGRKQLRPASWLWVDRYVDTDPRMELAAKAPQGDAQQGAFRAFIPAGATGIVGTGDIIMSGSNAIRDTADTDSVVAAARGSDCNRMAICVSGRDEAVNPGLDSAQINTFRTYNGPLAVYGSITAGVAGWKMLSTNTSYVYGAGLRVLDVLVATLRPLAQDEMGQTHATNADGTIATAAKNLLDTKFDTAVKLALGLLPGGAFATAQASRVTAQVLASSQLGNSPKRLDIAYTLQPRGVVTAVANAVQFSGTLSIS